MPRPVSGLDLRIVHPKVDPTEVSKSLGLVLFRGWRAGEIRTNPKGAKIGGVRKESYCCFTLEESSRLGPAALLRKWNQRLSSKRSYLKQLRETGGVAEYYVWWYCTGKAQSTGETFNREVLADLVTLSLGLSIEVLHD